MSAEQEIRHELSSPLLSKMRRISLVFYTLVWTVEFGVQADRVWRANHSSHHLSVIVPSILIVGCAMMGILGLCNMVFIRNPRSRLYLFRWMST